VTRPIRQLALITGLPAVLFATWWTTTSSSDNFFFPPLKQILATFGDVWNGQRLSADVLPSATRLAAGYLTACLLGIGVGVLIGSQPRLRALAEPTLEFLRAIPPPVMVPIIMLFAGIGDGMKIIVIVTGCVWPILLNTVEGVRAVDAVTDEATRSYGVTGAARLRHLVLPAAGPQIFAGMRQALSIGIILMVISEMFAASNGLGFSIVQFQRTFAIPEMWSGIILLGLLGVALSVVFRLVERRVLTWYHGLRRTQRSS
jgi:ABC-type nitrate/sulfonate/bicarbonate transport system permease component